MCRVCRVFKILWILIIIITVVFFASLVISFFPLPFQWIGSLAIWMEKGILKRLSWFDFRGKWTFVQWKWFVALKFVHKDIGCGWDIKADELNHAFELKVFVWRETKMMENVHVYAGELAFDGLKKGNSRMEEKLKGKEWNEPNDLKAKDNQWNETFICVKF